MSARRPLVRAGLRGPAFMLRSLVLLSLVASASALAADERVPVFVDEVAVPKGTELDGRALTSSLCTSLAKDARLDVICAPDVKQLVAFSTQLAMLGKESPALGKLEKQVEGVRWVLRGRVEQPEPGRLVFELGVHDKHPRTEGLAVLAGERKAVLQDAVADTSGAKLLERIPALAKRAGEQMVREVKAATPPPPPPELEAPTAP